MKIAAMAAGAVGAYFGGRMQAGGHDVAYIARRAHLDALRKVEAAVAVRSPMPGAQD